MRTGSNGSGGSTAPGRGKNHVSGNNGGGSRGHIYVIGLGPGDREHMSARAVRCIRDSEVIIGYKTYLELIRDLLSAEQTVVSSGMKREVKRCEQVLEYAVKGYKVALVSSGDPGVYGMAGVMFQVLMQHPSDIPVEIVPGVTAASAAAAGLGAPLMHDFACISLSDLLTPWATIRRRVQAAAAADFVIALYNPKSKSRTRHIEEVRELLLSLLPEDRPVGLVRNAKRGEEEVTVSTLKDFTLHTIDMFTTVIIGNSQTYIRDGLMVTPRGYKL